MSAVECLLIQSGFAHYLLLGVNHAK